MPRAAWVTAAAPMSARFCRKGPLNTPRSLFSRRMLRVFVAGYRVRPTDAESVCLMVFVSCVLAIVSCKLHFLTFSSVSRRKKIINGGDLYPND